LINGIAKKTLYAMKHLKQDNEIKPNSKPWEDLLEAVTNAYNHGSEVTFPHGHQLKESYEAMLKLDDEKLEEAGDVSAAAYDKFMSDLEDQRIETALQLFPHPKDKYGNTVYDTTATTDGENDTDANGGDMDDLELPSSSTSSKKGSKSSFFGSGK